MITIFDLTWVISGRNRSAGMKITPLISMAIFEMEKPQLCNGTLRRSKPDISHIDSVHASPLSSLKDDLLLFRGISSDFGRYLLSLERFQEKAYLSTSYSLYDAVQYAIEAEQDNPEKDGSIYLVVIEKKAG